MIFDEVSKFQKRNLQVFRIFKLARVLKLARHSPGLQVIRFINVSKLVETDYVAGNCLHPAVQLQGAWPPHLPRQYQWIHLCQVCLPLDLR